MIRSKAIFTNYFPSFAYVENFKKWLPEAKHFSDVFTVLKRGHIPLLSGTNHPVARFLAKSGV